MNYPVAYAVIPEEEMIYISGGKEPNYKGLFDYFIGDYLRDVVKGDVRDAVWNSAKQSSFTPITNWFKKCGRHGCHCTPGLLLRLLSPVGGCQGLPGLIKK